jgi:phage baseplate assembly protein W
MAIPNQYGQGLAIPLRFLAGSGFETASGERLVRMAILQILGTEPGELPWRPEFGIALRTRLHKNMDSTMAALVAHEVQQALLRWEPRIEVTGVEFSSKDTTLRIKVTWKLRPDRISSAVDLAPFSTEVTV